MTPSTVSSKTLHEDAHSHLHHSQHGHEHGNDGGGADGLPVRIKRTSTDVGVNVHVVELESGLGFGCGALELSSDGVDGVGVGVGEKDMEKGRGVMVQVHDGEKERGGEGEQKIAPITFPDGGFEAWSTVAACTLICLTAFGTCFFAFSLSLSRSASYASFAYDESFMCSFFLLVVDMCDLRHLYRAPSILAPGYCARK